MRRRLRTKHKIIRPKPQDSAWMTTSVIMVAGLLWFILHLYSTVVYSCEEVIAWWFDREDIGLATQQWTSLLVITLALWLYVDIIRPKRVRIPGWIRAGQISLVSAMVVLSVFQSGVFRPESPDARVYAYFQDEITQWPIINRLTVSNWVRLETHYYPPADLNDPIFDAAIALQERNDRAFSARRFGHYGRAGGRYNGRLNCAANAELNQAWEQAYEAYFLAEQERLEAELEQPDMWELTPLPPVDEN
jgi:hypothetical protein